MCLFCQFVSGEIPVNKVFENDDMIIIRDINPQAKNHFLGILKEHFKFIGEADDRQAETIGRCLKTIASLSELLELGNGYRIVINQGDDADQSVPHLHIHILSGQKMGWTPA